MRDHDDELESDLERHPLAAVSAALAQVEAGEPFDAAHVRALITSAIDQADAAADPSTDADYATAIRSLAARYRRLLPAVDHLEAGELEAARTAIRSAINPGAKP